MKAGKYYIGDPCYVIPDDEWMDFLEPYWENEPNFKFKGIRVWAHGTAYGDGLFHDQDGHEYGVDAGMIGAIPFELANKFEEGDGRIVTFEHDFECEYVRGVFHIGDFVIDTN